MKWEYSQSTSIIFGNDTLEEVSTYIEGDRGLLITSPSFIKKGYVEKIKKLTMNKVVYTYSEVSPNPDEAECQKCLDEFKNKTIDFVIALGGGSVIDFAKIISVAITTHEHSWLQDGKNIPMTHVPFIAIPTTAGTGSEVTSVSVLTNRKKGLKMPYIADSFCPTVAIVDPVLTYSLSPYMTACSGLDVLCHAIEAYWSKQHQPICDALAVHVIKLVFSNLKKAYAFPLDTYAREKMSEASLLAGLAFRIPKTTSMHACSYPFTNVLHIPHGEACALTLEYFIAFNHRHHCKRVEDLARTCGFTSVEDMICHISALKKELQVLTSLKEFLITEDMKHQIVKDCMNANLLNNPIEVSVCDVYEMLQTITK